MIEVLSDRFYEKGRNFLGSKYPFMCGAMTWVSDPTLVAAVCNAGGFGCLAGVNTPDDILEKQIDETKRLTDQPFAVNLITVAPAYKGHIELLLRKPVPIVIFAGSIPRANEVEAIKSTGAKIIAFAPTLALAKRMIRAGADALMIEGNEAGGHIGLVSLTVLLQQILFEVDSVPVFVAGGIATGRMAAHLFMLGAAGVQLGTRFAIAEESLVHEKFKKAFLRAHAKDAQPTSQFDQSLPVIGVRGLKNKGVDKFGELQLELIKKLADGKIERHEAQLELEAFWMGALRKAAIEGDIEYGSMMAGQSVGLVKKVEPVSDIIKDLVDGVENEMQAMKSKLK